MQTLKVTRARHSAPQPKLDVIPKGGEEFGVRLRIAREARRLSQQQLAEAIGVTQAAISRYEGGRYSPRTELAQILIILEVNWAWLFHGTGPMDVAAAHISGEALEIARRIDALPEVQRKTKIRALLRELPHAKAQDTPA